MAAASNRRRISSSGQRKVSGAVSGGRSLTRLRRVGGRAGDASDADAEVARKHEEYVTGAITWSRIDAAGAPSQMLADARAAIASQFAEP